MASVHRLPVAPRLTLIGATRSCSERPHQPGGAGAPFAPTAGVPFIQPSELQRLADEGERAYRDYCDQIVAENLQDVTCGLRMLSWATYGIATALVIVGVLVTVLA